MEIIFLVVGLVLIAVGIALIVSKLTARRGTEPIEARVVGFSHGKSTNPNMASFHSVAEYIGQNGQKYFIEGSVGSSVPLHTVGEAVTVLANPTEPEKAVLKSSLSFTLAGVMALLGIVSGGIFWLTFRLNAYSAVMAAIVIGGAAMKIKSAWREQPLSLGAWQAYKQKTLAPRVFTNETKDQILWADSMRVASATENYKRANRFAIPILLILGLGFLFLGYYFHDRTQTFLDKADRAGGIVVELRERDSDDSQSTYAAVVRYNDSRGRNFEFVDSFSSSPPVYHTGQRVNMLYNREDPNEAQIDCGLGNYWLTACFGSLGALFLLLALHSVKRRIARAGITDRAYSA